MSEPVKTESCTTYRPKKMSDFETGKDNIHFIGEVAGFISSNSFEGISSAIISGNLLAQAFLSYNDPKDISICYNKKTRNLRLKLTFKIFKRWFMYTPFVRKVIMKTGLDSIAVKEPI